MIMCTFFLVVNSFQLFVKLFQVLRMGRWILEALNDKIIFQFFGLTKSFFKRIPRLLDGDIIVHPDRLIACVMSRVVNFMLTISTVNAFF